MKEKIEKLEKCVMPFGKGVKALHRSKIEDVNLNNLKIGEWRFLSEDEVKALKYGKKYCKNS